MSDTFISQSPELEDYWRGIILFGRNVASYKFALARSLLEISPSSGELLKIEDLAPSFARHITEHLKKSDKQSTSRSSTFLDTCRSFNEGKLSEEQLVEQTIRHGFVNVIDAFHVVGQGEISERFYLDERKENNGIRITDAFSQLLENPQSIDLPNEVEARWRLVETAWELGVSRNIISINHDIEHESLFTVDNKNRRKTITSSRDALNGYQKGQCFYCYTDIHLMDYEQMPDVDHFIPHILKPHLKSTNLDGIWNLVLACRECNRGEGGKFEQVPTLSLLERLHQRNEYLISSHHPLRETLIQQTGNTTEKRTHFLNDIHNKAHALLLHTWQPEEKAQPRF